MIHNKIASLEARLARLEKLASLKTSAVAKNVIEMVEPGTNRVFDSGSYDYFKNTYEEEPAILMGLEKLKLGEKAVTVRTSTAVFILKNKTVAVREVAPLELDPAFMALERIPNKLQKETLSDIIEGIESVSNSVVVSNKILPNGVVVLEIESESESSFDYEDDYLGSPAPQKVRYMVKLIGDEKYSFDLVLVDQKKKISGIKKSPYNFGRYIVDMLR
jgi:hypothetical protein